MELTPYVEMLREELAAVTDVTDAAVREAVERALRQLDPTARLVFMNLLADTDAEITRLLQECGVHATVQAVLNGRNPEHQVTVAFPSIPEPLAQIDASESAAGEAEASKEEEGEIVRITLRLPSRLKAKAEVLADEAGMSLNSWIVDAVRGANSGVSAHMRELQQVLSTMSRVGVDIAHIPGAAGAASRASKGRSERRGGGPPRSGSRTKNLDGWI